MYQSKVIGGILGLAIGDALGVPVEFTSRETLRRFPVTDMRAFGVHHQPKGTWSDDSSMAFCILASLIEQKAINLNDIAQKFCLWYTKSYMTPHDNVFDIGNTTQYAISRLLRGTPPENSGDRDEDANGNGSLMRTLPLVFALKNKTIEERFDIVAAVSKITHAHIRSVVSCFYYIEFALQLLEGKDKFLIYNDLQKNTSDFLKTKNISEKEINLFKRLLKQDISKCEEAEIKSSGYVLHTLEASIWCLLTSNNYAETTLKAVNLGSDTDTTGTVAGGLAGILYGEEGIPTDWKEYLVKSVEIRLWAEQLFDIFGKGDPSV